MRQTQKQKLLAEKAILADKVNTILETIGKDRIYQFITDDLDNELEYIDAEIEDEQSYADENKTGAYKSSGTEARKEVKYLKTVKKKQVQVMKMFQDFLAMKKKVDKL
jgi:hypothetical protein